tara:strand:- start:453 stop:878 length:426 start_codon:yes stop_codon:yes gene_type:complete
MKMKNITTLLVKGILGVFVISFMYAGTVGPSLSMRFNNLLASDNALPAPAVCLGLEANVGEGVFAGIDSDGTDHRLYVKMGYGTFGMGTNAGGDAQFTIGGNYSVLDRFSVNLDYVLNQLTDDGAGDPFPDELRVSLKVDF